MCAPTAHPSGCLQPLPPWPLLLPMQRDEGLTLVVAASSSVLVSPFLPYALGLSGHRVMADCGYLARVMPLGICNVLV
jgi:hypothetical protein